eukprot:8040166-Ditylum_brightwellii.AAC.1
MYCLCNAPMGRKPAFDKVVPAKLLLGGNRISKMDSKLDIVESLRDRKCGNVPLLEASCAEISVL